MVLVGNKNDLTDERDVLWDYASKFAMEKLDCTYLETSAKYNCNIHDLFVELIMKALKISNLPATRNNGLSKFSRISLKTTVASLKPPLPSRSAIKRHSSDGGRRADDSAPNRTNDSCSIL